MGKVSVKGREELSFISDRFDNDTYNEVAKSASLVQLHLTECSYRANVAKILIEQDQEGDLIPSFKGEPTGCSFHDREGCLFGEYTWTAEIRHGRNKLLKLKCSYVLIYDGLNGCDEDHVRLYFRKVGRFASYPYFRTQFSTNVSSSGLTFPPLPSLTDRVD